MCEASVDQQLRPLGDHNLDFSKSALAQASWD